jgi:histidinol phosphatase-like enzyme
MIGDRMSDLFTGRNAGCKDSCLVMTGYGEKDRENALKENFQLASDLLEAVQKLSS